VLDLPRLDVGSRRARGYSLPQEIVCLEDSVTVEDYRGKSIAPAAWSGIADTLERTGVRSIVTKIEESNLSSRKTVSKAGFEEIATMRFRRRGLSSSTTVEAGEGAAAAWLAEKLQC
jgi:RimJ/RimL family protein N-acetyltransferase